MITFQTLIEKVREYFLNFNWIDEGRKVAFF